MEHHDALTLVRTTLTDPPAEGLRQETSSNQAERTHFVEPTEEDLAHIEAGMIVTKRSSLVDDHQHDYDLFLCGSTP